MIEKNKKEYQKRYQEVNKERLKAKRKLYREANKERLQLKEKEHYENNKELIKLRKNKWYESNKDRVKNNVFKYYKERRANDPLFKTKTNYMNSINLALKKAGYTKSGKTECILGCSYKEFHEYLESQFEPWMTWENRGLYKKDTYNYGWDVDHIIPTSSAKTEDELIKLFHYTNLKPLCSKVNRDVKRNKTQT